MTADGSDYFYPGTRVLRNLQDIRDAERLREFERESSLIRMAEILLAEPDQSPFDRARFSRIHSLIFRDVYAWAGKERASGEGLRKFGPSPESIRRGDFDAYDMHAYEYLVAGDGMRNVTDRALASLPSLPDARRISPGDFADAIAVPWGRLNHAHLFREGNTRAQVIFFTQLAMACGQSFDSDRFTRDEAFRARFNAGRFLFIDTGDPSVLRDAIRGVIVANTPGPSPVGGVARVTPGALPAPAVMAPETGGRCGSTATATGEPCRNRVGDACRCWRHR